MYAMDHFIYTMFAPCSLNTENIELVTRRWIDAGKPAKPDWSELLTGITPKQAE
jgi:uncharacterized membrane protein YhaH (DUF805 family)